MKYLAFVTITIVAIVALFLMLFGSKGCQWTKRQSTNRIVQSLTMSMKCYKADFDAYPPSPTRGTPDDGTLFDCLCGPGGKGIFVDRGRGIEKYGPYVELSTGHFIKSESGKTIIVDEWGMPIHYFNCEDYVKRQHGNPAFCHNPQSFDLYSTGPNGGKDSTVVEPGTRPVGLTIHVADDITNFGERPAK